MCVICRPFPSFQTVLPAVYDMTSANKPVLWGSRVCPSEQFTADSIE